MPSQIDLTLGAVEVGALLSCMLYGAVTVQLYTYSGRCRNDPWWLIGLVSGVWILETFFTVLSICYLYGVSITNFGNAEAILDAPWTLDMCIAFQGTVGASIQSFFAYRVWKVSGSLLWPSLAWVGAIARIGLTVTITVFTLKIGNIAIFAAHYGWAVIASLVVSLSVDILNVVALSWYLSGRKPDFENTARMIDRLILFSIETGLITSITAICMLVTRLAMPDNYVWIGLLEIYARMYSNSLMVSLNMRVDIKEKFMNKVSNTPSAGETPSNNQWVTERGISIQMVSFTEVGDPGQERETKGLTSPRTGLNIPFEDC